MAGFNKYKYDNMFSEKSLRFESGLVDNEKIPIQSDGVRSDCYKFGILNFKAITCEISKKNQEFLFMVDCSASMSDKCSDGRNKMQHILHTLKNMITFFCDYPSISTNITVTAFDNIIHEFVERINVNRETLPSILEKIDRIHPNGSTDIENALKYASKSLKNLREDHPLHNISHIFMTDGEATSGSQDHSILSGLVVKEISNIFIGFGFEHDASLLNNISADVKSSYYFIDKLESSGLVYGEILHGIVYKLLTDVKLTINNGLLYDFKSNVWCDTIYVGDIVSEANKDYHVVSTDPELCDVTISGIEAETNGETIRVAETQTVKIETTNWLKTYDNDLTKYIYRQRTLQHLYKVNSYLRLKGCSSTDDLDTVASVFPAYSRPTLSPDMFRDSDTAYKNTLREFLEEMKQYMRSNDLNDDCFMVNLCDDIYICHRTFGTRYGTMFTSARQASQGSQRGYTVSNTPDAYPDADSHPRTPNLRINTRTRNMNGTRNGNGIYDDQYSASPRRIRPPRLIRNNSVNYRGRSFDINDSFSDNEDSDADTVVEEYKLENPDEIVHDLSGFPRTPYLTPQASQVMRAINGSVFGLGIEEEQSI